jgi:hypothetical protein
VALMRDDLARAVDTMPLTLKLLRPDGVEARRDTVKAQAIGAYAFDLPFSKGVLTGRWTVQAHLDPAAPPVGTLRLLVEDVVPPRIEVKLSAAAPCSSPHDDRPHAQGRLPLWRPGRHLPAEGEVVIMADDKRIGPPRLPFRPGDETVDPQRTALPRAAHRCLRRRHRARRARPGARQPRGRSRR